MAKYTFGAAESSGGGFGGGGSFGSGSSFGKSSGAGVSRAPSVNPKDLDKEEEKVYREAFDKSFNPDLFDNEDEAYLSAAVDAEDVLFSFRGERRSQVENAAIKPEKIIGGWNLAGPQSSMPSLDPSKIEDPGDEKVYRQAFDESFNGNPDNDDDSRYIGAALNGEYALREKYGYANPKSLSMSEYAAMQNRAIDEREAYQAQKAEQGPLNQGPQNAAYMAAEQERMEREQRERDDAQTGAGARVQQIVAQKELERKLAEGSIRNEQLRQNAQRDLDNLRSMNEQGITLSQEGLAGVWQTIEGIREEERAPAFTFSAENPQDNGFTFGAEQTEVTEDAVRATLDKIQKRKSELGTGDVRESYAVQADENALNDYLNGITDDPESVRPILEKWKTGNYSNDLGQSPAGQIQKFMEEHELTPEGLAKAISEKSTDAMRLVLWMMNGSQGTLELYHPTLDKMAEIGNNLPTGAELLDMGIDTGMMAVNRIYAGLGKGVNAITTGANAFAHALGFDVVNEALLGDNAIDREKARQYVTGKVQEAIINPLLADAERYGETSQEKISGLLTNNFGVDPKVAEEAANIFTHYFGEASEMIGRMSPMMLAWWAGGPSAAVETTGFMGKIAAETSTLEFLTNWLQSTGDAYQAAIDKYGDNITYWDAATSVISGWFDAYIENHETKWGLSNGIQAIAKLGRAPRIGEAVGSVVSEDMEELKQLLNSDVWENASDLLSGREMRHPLDMETEESMFNLAKYWDTLVESTGSTLVMSGLMGAGNSQARKYETAVSNVLNGTASAEERAMAADVMAAVGVAQHDEEMAAEVKTPTPEEQHNTFENAANGNEQRPAPGGTDARAKAAVESAGAEPSGQAEAAKAELDRAQAEFDQQQQAVLDIERHDFKKEDLDAQLALLNEKKAALDKAQINYEDAKRAAEKAGNNRQAEQEQQAETAPEAPIVNEPAREENNLPPAETDVRTAEQRMREAQAAEVQAIVATNNPDMPEEERAQREQEARDASARRAAAEEEYRRAQAAADAAVKNQNDQVDLRNQEEQRAQQAQDEARKAELRLKRAQEARQQAEEAAKQQGLQARERAEAEKKAGIARRQERRAQEAYNQALKAADEQNQQADARKASDEAAQNSIDQMVGILQEDDQTNMNAQDVAPDQNRQAAERLQLEEEARAAEQRMQEARAAEVQAIVATNNPDMPEEERAQREQEARDAIARREEAENEYREAQAAVDALGEFVPQEEPEQPEQPESNFTPQERPEDQKSELVPQDEPAKPEQPVGNFVPQEKPEEQKSELVNQEPPAKPDDQVGTLVEDEAGEAGDGQGNAEAPKAEEPLNTLVEDEEEEAGEGEGSTGEEQPANEEENEAGENEGNTGETLSPEDQQLVDNANKHNDSLGFSHYDGTNWKPGVTIKTAPATLSQGQRSELSVFDSYAKKKGYTLVVHDQLFNEDGESVNGFYRPDEDSGRVIHVALDSENPLRSTMGHELYHMLKELNPEGAKRVAKEFARWANKAGVDINSLVRSKVELYYGQGYIKDKTDRRAWDYAYEEVVCDSLLDVIGDQQTVQALAIGDRNLVQRMSDWISKTMQQIHQMLSEYAQGSDEARILTEQEGALEKIREVFDKALDETNALQESKKAGRSLGSNSKMMDAYIKGLDAATTYSEANAEATKLAASVLKSQGLETSSKNINDVISMAQMMEAGYMLSEAAKELGIDIKSTPETERAIRALGRYVTSLLQQDKIEELEALYGMGEASDETITEQETEEEDVDEADGVNEETASGEEAGVRYSAKNNNKQRYDITKSWGEQIEDLDSNNFPNRQSLIMGRTPEVLIKIGMSDLPMTMDQLHAWNAMHGDADHNMGKAMLKQLPDMLKKPVAVFKSAARPNDSIMVIVDGIINGKQETATLRIDYTGYLNGNSYDTNNVITVLGRGNAITKHLVDAMNSEITDHGSVYYMDKQKATQLLAAHGVQFPVAYNAYGYVHNIQHEGPLVNNKFFKQTDSQQFKRWFGNSKTVNPDGSPKIMYHGTHNSFTVFDISKAKYSGLYGKGFYFTDDPNRAGTYGNKMAVYLQTNNPLQIGDEKITKKQLLKFVQAVADNEDYGIDNYGEYATVRSIVDGLQGKDDFSVLQDINATCIGDLVAAVKLFNDVNGTNYDSIIAPTETVVFEPTQIKSATDNIGTFDPKEPDIRYSAKKNRDQEYQRAIDSGDVEKQQRMVKEAASEAGYIPVARYHQTGERFTEFKTDNPVAGANDSETPNGIFFKENDHDIGVGGDYVNTGHGGDIQMQVYLKMNHPLHFANRNEAKAWYEQNVPGYKELSEEWEKINSEKYEPRFKEIENEMFAADTTDERYEELDHQEEELIKELSNEETSYRKRMRELLNDYFLNGKSEYDGIELVYDGSRYIDGKKEAVHTYIVFDPRQVKSADPITYDKDGKPIPLSERFNDKKPDIRWSAKKNQDKETSDKAADEKRLLEVETDIAGNDMQVWDLLKVMREMKRGQDAEGTEKGYWKKDIPKIVKTLEEEINSVGRTKEIIKLVTEYFEDLDAFEGTTAAFMDYALQQGQALVTDLYRGEHRAYNQAMMQDYEGGKNAIRDFFRGGYWYISPAMKEYINTYIDSYRGFRRVMNAAGIRVTTVEGEKKSGHSVDLESAWKPRDPRTGRSDSNGLYEMLGGEETDSLGDIVQKVYDAITRESADEDVSLTMEEYDLTGKVGLTLVADYLQAGAMKEGARVSEEARGQKAPTEMDRLREETSAQRGVLQQKSDEIEQLNKEIDKLNNALSKEIGRSSKLAMQLKEMKRNGAAAEKLAQAKAELATANKEKQKAVNALEKAREKLDAQKDELNELKKQLRKTERAYDNALSQMDDLKERRAEQMENMKNRLIEKYKKEAREKIAQAKARQKATKHRRQLVAGIRNTGAKLKNYMAHPNATNGYIPQQNAERAAELIEIMMANDGRKSAAKAGRRLMDSIRDAKESPDYFVSTMYDDELNRAMQEVARILEDKQSLYNLDDAELEIVHKTLKAINHQIQNADKTIGRQKNAQLASEAADGVLLMQRNRESMKGVGRMIRKGVLTHLNPQRFFAIWGHHGDNAITRMGEEASEGQRKKNKMTMDMTKVFEGLTQGENEKKFDKFTGKNATWYDTGIHILDERGNDTGRTWKITEAMRTFFALSWQADENKEGMRAGVKMNGHEMYQLTIPDEELMKKGKEKEAYARGERVYFTEADANEIIGELTDYEKQWMTAWRDMEKISKQAINETSLLLNGFRKANVGNYVPIFRDPRYIGKEFETVVTDSRLTSMGFLKERVNSHLPMMLMDLKNVINRQVRDVSDYYGFAIPARNLTKIYNANFGGTSFKEVMNKTQGMEVGQYFEKLMADLQGGNRVESSPLDKLRGNVAGAVLSGNPSVIIKQAASYPAAASVLGWKPLLKGLKYFNPAGLKGINVDKIDQYTSALWERRSRSLSDLEANANRNTRMSKTMHWLTNGIQGMDVATTKVIWKAAEYYVDEHNPNLSRGTDEYNRAVARIYEQALEGTQPEYGTMQRPGILRSQSQIVKSLTMYKTQSLQNFNILVDAATNLSDKAKAAKANNSEENQAALKAAKRQMATALSSQITSAVILGVMTAVGKALLHKLGGYRDDKGDLTAESVGGQILKDSASSMAGMVAGGSELFDLINGLIEGQSPFDIEAAGVSTINDLYQNTYAFLDAMKVIGDGDLTDAQKLSQMWPKVRKLGLSVTQLLGLPVGNFANLIDGIAANAADFATGKPGSFASGSPLQIAGTPIIGSAQGRETSNKSVAGYIAQAMMDGDEAEAMRLYNEQIRQGKSVDALNSAIASWQKANIPEIRQAAEAIDAGDLSLYNQLINELTGKGLSMTNAVKYVEAERKKMTAEPKKEEEASGALTYQEILSGMTKETKTSEENSYTNGMMNSLLEDGNVQAAMAVRDDMLANGKTKSSISSSLSSFWKPRLQEAYQNGDMVTVRQVTQMLVQMGLKHTTIQGWTSSTGTSSSSSSSKSSFGSGSFGGGSFGNSKKSSSKKSSFGSGSFGGKGFGK